MSADYVAESTETLAKHVLREVDPACSCGWDWDPSECVLPSTVDFDPARYRLAPDVRPVQHRAHVAAALIDSGAVRPAAGVRAEALREALSGVTTHNGTPVTPKNLRWAATHEALCRSYIFDVLTGLADALDEAR